MFLILPFYRGCIEVGANCDLVSENASDFPEVIARPHASQIVLRPHGLARLFSQDAWQEHSSQERKYVLSILRIDKQSMSMLFTVIASKARACSQRATYIILCDNKSQACNLRHCSMVRKLAEWGTSLI